MSTTTSHANVTNRSATEKKLEGMKAMCIPTKLIRFACIQNSQQLLQVSSDAHEPRQHLYCIVLYTKMDARCDKPETVIGRTISFLGGAENASTGKRKYGKCKYNANLQSDKKKVWYFTSFTVGAFSSGVGKWITDFFSEITK